MRQLPLLLFLLMGFALCGQSDQTTASCLLKGKVTEHETGDPLPFAIITLYQHDSVELGKQTTNADGHYAFRNLAAGNYSLRIQQVGYDSKVVTRIKLSAGKTVTLNISLSSANRELDEVMVISPHAGQRAPLVKKEDVKANQTQLQGQPGTGAVLYGWSKGKYRNNRAEPLERDGQAYNREGYQHLDDNGFKEVKNDPLSTFSIDVDRASYSNVRRFLQANTLPQPDAVRIEELINYFKYDYPQPEGRDPFSISTEYTDCPWNNGHSLVHIGLQGKEVKLDRLPANNLTFLIDVSGSMMDDNKLPLLKSGLRLLIEAMRPQDKISLVVYAGAAGLVLPPTSGDHKDRIMDALEKLQAGGSTAGGAGIALAYATAREHFDPKGNNRIILATDGDFNVGVSSDGELTRLIEKEREDGIFLSVLGFGTGNYQDGKMEQLADKGNGNYAYIDNLLEAKKVLVKEMGGTLLTIAKDVKLQIEFNPAKVKAYRLVGYENRLLNKEDFNDDKKDAGELGSGHSVTAIYEIIPAGSREQVASTDPLKYQEVQVTPGAGSAELMTIKFRYKEPSEKTSQLLSHIVYDRKVPFAEASENCRFAAAVSEFGMLLRDSGFKGNSDFKGVIALAKSARGKDEEGYRAEFIRLAEIAELLKK